MSALSIPANEHIEIDAGCVVAIGETLPGFPDLDELAIIPVDEYGMFVWLSATGEDEVAFLAVNPFVFFPDYDVELSTPAEANLCFEPGDAVIVFCLVSIDRDSGEATANLMAPLVVNTTRARALQVILDGDQPLRAPLAAPGGGSAGDVGTVAP